VSVLTLFASNGHTSELLCVDLGNMNSVLSVIFIFLEPVLRMGLKMLKKDK
jgi:hypothetical protein